MTFTFIWVMTCAIKFKTCNLTRCKTCLLIHEISILPMVPVKRCLELLAKINGIATFEK